MKKETEALKCTYKYKNATTCNRPIIRGFKDKEGEQYCIFHARNDEKLEELKNQMGIEISNATESNKKDMETQNLSENNENYKDKIAELRTKYALNYEGSYFPAGFDLFNNSVIKVDISFNSVIFDGSAIFYNATFSGEANFRGATFSGKANFYEATFSGEVYFIIAIFSREADFQGATFSGDADFSIATFSGKADFYEATFSGKADFGGVTFSGKANFYWTTFSEVADFVGATFSGVADFNKATFSSEANFREATFNGNADFSEVAFSGAVYFNGVTLSREANFYKATFSGEADFSWAIFSGKAYFYEATFSGETDFHQVAFKGVANFNGATFSDVTFFKDATFRGETYFRGAAFSGEACFSRATFSGNTNFYEATFSSKASFNEATFSGVVEFTDVLFIADVTFDLCRLYKGKLKFLDTAFFSTSSFSDISEGSSITFINCCFSGVSFLRSRIADTVFSNCCFNLTEGWINKKIQKINNELRSNWVLGYEGERLNQKSSLLKQEKDKIEKSKGRNKRLQKKNLLLEHRDFLKQPHFRLLMRKLLIRGLKIASAPLLYLFPRKFNSIRKIVNTLKKELNLIDFGELRDNYMQLKVNMDRMKDYDLANDFYYGEMEMKRLGEKWYKPKRWFLALYRFLSGHGNNPGQAVIMFFVCMFLFSIPSLFMKIDRIQHSPTGIKTVRVRWQASLTDNFKETSSLMLYNVVALSHFAEDLYRTTDKCTIAYLFFVQYLFRPVQVALIILAIRRKVKRGEE